MLEMVRSFSRG